MYKIIIDINNNLSDIIKLENEIFGGGFLSIFKRKNFSVINTLLLIELEHLSYHRDRLENISASGMDANLEISFVDALYLFTNKMSDIAGLLSKKATGDIKYSTTNYSTDISSLKYLQSKYLAIGVLLNKKWS